MTTDPHPSLPAVLLAVLLFSVPAQSVGTSSVFGVRIAILPECTARPAIATKNVAITCQPGSTPYQTEVYHIDEDGEHPIDPSDSQQDIAVEETPRIPFTFDAIRPVTIMRHKTDSGANEYSGRIVYGTF